MKTTNCGGGERQTGAVKKKKKKGKKKKKKTLAAPVWSLSWCGKGEKKKKVRQATPEAHLQVGKREEEERSHHFVSAKKEGKSPGKK